MARKLHVTNGDSIVPEIEAVAPDDPVLPWRDVLHEGPVPGGMDEAALRAVRVEFLARAGWGDGVILLDAFERRDAKLERAITEAYDIWLWFEDDLYDQLQLVQVLAMIAARVPPGATQLLQRVTRDREVVGELEIGDAERQTARRVWAAFRSSDPRVLQAIDARALPDAPRAIDRMLEEYPWTTDGLGLTERVALIAIAEGKDDPLDVFRAVQEAEERPFMGDHWAWVAVDRMARGDNPLVVAPLPPQADITPEFATQRYELTETGQAVL
ncbi:MAG: hypothetical protein QOJ12_3267, partial [Thermoleophilales bacterium]|nr:hypothetical protein [Thermoleophilales bacterium]